MDASKATEETAEMKTVIKFFGLAVMAIAMPLFAQSATAAEFRQLDAKLSGLTGHMTPAPMGVLAKAPEAKKIVVAGRRGRWIGPAIVGGVIAGALLSGAARAHHERHYYTRDRYSNRCDRWLWKCEHGERWACRKFDYNC